MCSKESGFVFLDGNELQRRGDLCRQEVEADGGWRSGRRGGWRSDKRRREGAKGLESIKTDFNHIFN